MTDFPENVKDGRYPDFVQSLERGLAVIQAFGPETPELTLSEVARLTGLTRAAARRFLRTLLQLGYVHFDGRVFSLRPTVLKLGYSYLSTLSFTRVAASRMEDLVATVRESSSIAVLDFDEIVYVARMPTKRIMTVSIAIGTRFPAYATSMGRVLLAALSPPDLDRYMERVALKALTPRTINDPRRLRQALAEVRSQGYAIVDQELEEGLRSAAAPIVGSTGSVEAAINVSVHASRVTVEALRRTYLPLLRATAEQISTDLVALGTPPARHGAL